MLPDNLNIAASSFANLLSSNKLLELDKKYNVISDLVFITEGLTLQKDILERDRMGRNNVASFVQENAELYPERVALVFEGRTWSWRQFGDSVDKVAAWAINNEIQNEDPVCIVLSNTPSYLFVWLGIAKIGAIPCFIDYNLKGQALSHILSILPPRAIIVDETSAQNVENIQQHLPLPLPAVFAYGNFNTSFPKLDADALPTPSATIPCARKALKDLGMLLYTSGTTGLPKAWTTTIQKKLGIVFAGKHRYRTNFNDRILITTPLYHGTASLLAFGSALSVGGTAILLRKFSATRFWSIARETCATHCVYVGEIPRYLMNQPPSPDDRNHCIHTFNGLGMRPDIWVPFKRRFGITQVGEYWGQTESPFSLRNIQVTSRDGTEPGANYVGTLGPFGRTVSGLKLVRQAETGEAPFKNAQGICEEVRDGEAGQLLVQIDQSRSLGKGYYNNDEATKKKIISDPFGPGSGNWYLTGDILKVENSNWSFVDRSGDTFRWKGENVATSSVEMALHTFPGIRYSNVYGVKVPNQSDGRAGMALLVIDPEKFDLKKLPEHLNQNIPKYAHPLWLRVRSLQPETNTNNVSGLFKLVKGNLMNEAMDPDQMNGDSIYMFDEKSGVYHKFGPSEYAKVSQGNVAAKL